MLYFEKNVGYNHNMSVNIEKKSEQILMNVTPSTFKLVAKIAEIEKRPLGYVARELMSRGTDLYLEDGKLRDTDSRDAALAAIREGLRRGIPENATGESTNERRLAPVVARISPPEPKVIDEESIEEIRRRLASTKGIPLAQRSKKQIPSKLDETHTKAKRRNTR